MSCDPFLRLLLPSLFPASLIDVFVTGLLNLRTVTCITVLVGPFHPPQDTFHCSLHAADRKELNHAGLACWRCDIRIEIRTSHMWCMQISTTLIQQLESSHPYGGHASCSQYRVSKCTNWPLSSISVNLVRSTHFFPFHIHKLQSHHATATAKLPVNRNTHRAN